MLKIEKFVTPSAEQWEIIIESMRNPLNSWNRMDSEILNSVLANEEVCPGVESLYYQRCEPFISIGPNDHSLMKRLAKAGPVHAKYRRMIPVWVTLTAPLYLLKELDTYKIGTVCNSCSTMHKIQEKEFTLEDFSCEKLIDGCGFVPADLKSALTIDEQYAYEGFILCSGNHDLLTIESENGSREYLTPVDILEMYIINALNMYREKFLETKDKKYWWQMIQLLPSSYNQKRTYFFNYEVLANIYESRKGHKLDEWKVLLDWIEELPYSELITGEVEEDTNV